MEIKTGNNYGQYVCWQASYILFSIIISSFDFHLSKSLNSRSKKKSLVSSLCLTQLDSISLSQKVDLHSLSDLMYQPNRSFNIPPRHTPGIWRLFLAQEGGNLIASLDVMLRDKSWRRRRRRQTLMNSREKIAYSWRIGWKAKVYTSCVPYLKVFKNDLCL